MDQERAQYHHSLSQQVSKTSVNKWKRRAMGQVNVEMVPTIPYATRKRKTEDENILFVLENNQDARGKKPAVASIVNILVEVVNQPRRKK